MSVADIFEERSAFSFEVFPPKTDVGMEKLCGAGGVLEQLYTLNPALLFISFSSCIPVILHLSCHFGACGLQLSVS